eukprot:TRINITY_DN14273_c0_g1_i1.p1 TRINITY_DN14273_c0_g1~~TRINITY_DN14273_c0_g1_i1.p1  ORF type:complete len:379 (-),score=85.36 TRINITY_DN14273_c0_g1_i1:101-1177(-)
MIRQLRRIFFVWVLLSVVFLYLILYESYSRPLRKERQYSRLYDRFPTPPAGPFYIAANLYNSEDILPNFSAELIDVIQYLGTDNVFVSIWENGSKDNTKQLLRKFGQALDTLGVARNFVLDDSPKNTQLNRIEYLAGLRNRVMDPLYNSSSMMPQRMRSGLDDARIIFINDIYFSAEDVARLLWTNDGQYDMACGLDFYGNFYDRWVTRDRFGRLPASDQHPYFADSLSVRAVHYRLPVPVYSCWNGMVVMSARPFIRKGVRFRANPPDVLAKFKSGTLDKGVCYHSECLLVCTDFRNAGFTNILLNAEVRVAYTRKHYVLHNYIVPFIYPFLYWTTTTDDDVGPASGVRFEDVECGT